MKQLGILEAIESYERISEYLGIGMFALSLAMSLAAALFCSWLYRMFYESRGTGSQVHRAFPLLSLAITSLFLCIQISIPLSLGLLGSLSIIRFRTPIKEPEEVGSIMMVIATSIAAATFHFAFVGVLLAMAGAVTWCISLWRGGRRAPRDGLMTATFPDPAPEVLDALGKALDAVTSRHKIQSASSQQGMTTVQISFSGLKEDPCALQAAVRSAVPGVANQNVFLDRPGGFR